MIYSKFPLCLYYGKIVIDKTFCYVLFRQKAFLGYIKISRLFILLPNRHRNEVFFMFCILDTYPSETINYKNIDFHWVLDSRRYREFFQRG